MTDSVWLPGFIVLAIGIAFGVFLISKLRGQKGTTAPQDDLQIADLDLKVRDLEGRRDDLYRRIRRINNGEDIGDVPSLEIEAARVLQQLDLAVGQMPHKARKDAARRSNLQPVTAGVVAGGDGADGGTHDTTVVPKAPADQTFFGAHPLLAGFGFGAGMVALVGALIYFAVADAKPKPEGMGGPPPQAAQVSSEGLPEDASAQLDALKARLEADPNDLMAKKEIALLLLQAARWVEAFEVAGMILQDNPGDPDGLYVQGVVRLRMGQSEEAQNIFDEVLANYPQHVLAMLYRGLALHQGGNVEQAVDTWEFALDRSGDLRPQFERLIAMVERGEDPLEAIGFTGQSAGHPAEGVPASDSSPAAGAAPQAAMTPEVAEPNSGSATASERPMPTPDPSGYTVRVELAAGAQTPPGATLFVYLRGGASGPPVAVKRMPAAAFPIDLFLGADDSMMGSALPETGNIVVRLDGDGNVMSRDAGDLESTQSASMGSAIKVVLGG